MLLSNIIENISQRKLLIINERHTITYGCCISSHMHTAQPSDCVAHTLGSEKLEQFPPVFKSREKSISQILRIYILCVSSIFPSVSVDCFSFWIIFCRFWGTKNKNQKTPLIYFADFVVDIRHFLLSLLLWWCIVLSPVPFGPVVVVTRFKFYFIHPIIEDYWFIINVAQHCCINQIRTNRIEKKPSGSVEQ